MMAPADDGVRLVALPGDLADRAARRGGARRVRSGAARRGHFAAPQDVEWTLRRGELFALQSRPITTLAGEAGDGRAQYLSLRRSFENLERLRRRIEDEDLPAMTAAADRLAAASRGARRRGSPRGPARAQGRARPGRRRLRRRLRPVRPRRPSVRRRLQRRAAARRPLRVHRPAHGDADAEPAAQRRAAAGRRPHCATGGGGGGPRGRRVRRRVREAGDLRGRAEVLALARRLAARSHTAASAARRGRTWPSGCAASSRRTRRRSASEPRPCSTSLAPAGGCVTTTTSTWTAWSGCWKRRWTRRSGAACPWTTRGGRGR